MLLGVALTLLFCALAGVAVIIGVDVTATRRIEWLASLRNWQQLLGTVIGFIGAASVLVLGTAIEDRAEQQRAEATARAIGTGIAYEVESMVSAFEVGRRTLAGYDLTQTERLADYCRWLAEAVQQTMVRNTPVYNTSLQSLVNFGDENLAMFVRFHSFYQEFVRNVDAYDAANCAATPREHIDFIAHEIRLGYGYYGFIADRYPVATEAQLSGQAQ